MSVHLRVVAASFAICAVFGAPFTPGNLVALRVGDGATTLTTNLFPGQVVEVSPSTGEVVQILPLSSVADTSVVPPQRQCNFYGSSNAEGKISNFGNGLGVAIPCYNGAVGSLFSAATAMTAAVALGDGTVDTSTTATGGGNHRGIASNDGSFFYLGMSGGVKGIAYGASTGAQIAITTAAGSMAGIGVVNGTLFGAYQTIPSGIVSLFNSPLPTITGTATVASRILTGTQASGIYTTAFHWQTPDILWTVAYAASGTVGLLQRYTRNATNGWAMSAGYPKATVPFTNPVTGLATTASGLKSILGRTEEGRYALYLVGSASTSGGNWILRFDADTAVFSAVSQAAAFYQYQSIAWAPGALPSATPSAGASVSPTATATTSATASPTAQCAPGGASPAAFAATSVVILRVGSGQGPVGSASVAREGFLDEIDPVTGVRLQTVPLPTGPLVLDAAGALVSAPCTFNPATPLAGLLTRAVDARSLAIVCLAQAPGTPILAAGNKTLLSVRFDGAIAAAAVMTSYLSTTGVLMPGGLSPAVYGAVTDNSSNFFLSTGGGMLWIPRGRVGPGQIASTTAATGAFYAPFDGFVYRVTTAGAVGILGTAASTAGTPLGVYTNSLALTGASTGSAGAAGLWLPDALTAYVVDSLTAAGGPTISKFVRPDSGVTTAWTPAPGFPVRGYTVANPATGVQVAANDARGVTGYTDPSTGTFSLLFTSSAGLVRFNTADSSFAALAAPCAGDATMRWSGVAQAPVPPPTPSATPSGTSTGTPTPTSTLSSGGSISSTATQSGTPTASLTASATPTATPSSVCWPPASAPAPFSNPATGSVVVLRVGTGREPLPAISTASQAYLDEINIETGALLQTIALPTGGVQTDAATGALLSAGCTINTAQVTNGLLSLAADGRSLALACHPLEHGEPVTASQNRTVLTIRPSGAIEAAAVLNGYLSSTGLWTPGGLSSAINAAVTDNSSNFFLSTGGGVLWIPRGRVGPGQIASTTASVGLAYDPAGLWVYRVGATNGAAAFLGPSGGTATATGIYTNSWTVTGLSTGSATSSGLVFESQAAAFILDAGTVAGGPTITRFNRTDAGPGSVWSVTPGYPIRGFTVEIDGAPVVANDARGGTGVTGASGTFSLVFTSSVGLVRFVPSTGTFSLITAPCNPLMRLVGVAPAPWIPSSSSTPSVTASASPTATATNSFGTSPTPTGTGTPTGTPPRTPTASATPLCAPAAAAPAPFRFSGGTVAVLRVGSGMAPLSNAAVAREAFIDEIDVATGVTLQSIALPAGPAVTDPATGALLRAGCTMSTATNTTGMLTRAANGLSLALACLPESVGSVPAAGGNKTLLSIDPLGQAQAVSVMTSYLSSTGVWTAGGGSPSVYTAVTDDGANFFFAGASGVFWMPRGRVGAGQSASTTAATGMQWLGSWVYRSSTAGALAYLGPSGGSGTALGAYTNSYTMSGSTSGSATTSSIVFEGSLILYILDAGTGATAPTVSRFTRTDVAPGTAWTATGAPYPIRGFTVTTPDGGILTASDARGATGYTDPSTGAFSILFASSVGLVRFSPAEGSFALVAQPCGPHMRWQGVALAPVYPTPTPSPTASVTGSASPTGSPSSGSTPTQTPSVTASGSVTASRTASPTATATVLCAPPAASPAAFGAFSVVVLRVGDGRTPLTNASIAREAFLDEFDVATGALLQTIALPTGGVVTNATGGLVSAGCTINGGAAVAGLLTRNADGRSLVIPCHAQEVGTPVTAAGNKTIARASLTGAVGGAAVMSATLSSTGLWNGGGYNAAITGAIGAGDDFWLTTGAGALWLPAGRVGAAQVASTTAAMGIAYAGGFAYRVTTGGSLGLLGTAASNWTVAGAYTNSLSLGGATTGSATAAGIFMLDPLTVFIVDSGGRPTTPVVTKLTRAAAVYTSAWTLAPGYPVRNANATVAGGSGGAPVAVWDARGVTGHTAADGTFSLLLTSSAGLVRFNPDSFEMAIIAQPCNAAGMRFLGVAQAPVASLPSPSPTRTPTASVTATGTPSGTATGTPPATGTGTPSGTPSPTVSVSATGSGTRTGSGTPSGTRSQTGTPTASETGSVSATASETASVSATATLTSSVSASGTGTPSSSQTETGTPSSSQTGSQTGTASASGTPASTGTGTAASTATPSLSGTPTGTGSKTKVAVASKTSTASKTRTRTASRTRTRSRTKTPSKKKKLLRA